jgi:hypothetical protein
MITGSEHVFGVVRNPYDFLASCFVRRSVNRSMGFVPFVRNYHEAPYIEDGRIHYHEKDCHTVLRYERLQLEMDALMERLDLPTFELGRHNQTAGKKPWESYYTPEAFAVVNERFGQDFRGFYEPRAE